MKTRYIIVLFCVVLMLSFTGCAQTPALFIAIDADSVVSLTESSVVYIDHDEQHLVCLENQMFIYNVNSNEESDTLYCDKDGKAVFLLADTGEIKSDIHISTVSPYPGEEVSVSYHFFIADTTEFFEDCEITIGGGPTYSLVGQSAFPVVVDESKQIKVLCSRGDVKITTDFTLKPY